MGNVLDENPALIQDAPKLGQDAQDSPRTNAPTGPTPLVLIHDGGGTIFPYYCLGDLGRPLFGISNPHYQSGRAWEGGIPDMARHYLRLIKSAVPRGDILIGGWSLGGLVSLEVARQLADDTDKALNLLGIVMIDSVCPLVLTAPLLPLVQHAVQWSKHTKQETKYRVLRCFADATRMVNQWKLPQWEEEDDGAEERGGINGSRRLMAQPKTPSPRTRHPAVILLRATEPVSVPGQGVSGVDTHRGDRLLGWGCYRKDLITQVVDIPGNHFNIFHTEEHLEAATDAVRMACLELEAISSSRWFT